MACCQAWELLFVLGELLKASGRGGRRSFWTWKYISVILPFPLPLPIWSYFLSTKTCFFLEWITLFGHSSGKVMAIKGLRRKNYWAPGAGPPRAGHCLSSVGLGLAWCRSGLSLSLLLLPACLNAGDCSVSQWACAVWEHRHASIAVTVKHWAVPCYCFLYMKDELYLLGLS